MKMWTGSGFGASFYLDGIDSLPFQARARSRGAWRGYIKSTMCRIFSFKTINYNLELIDPTTSFVKQIVETVNQDVARSGYPSSLYYIIVHVLLSAVDWNVRYHVAGHCLPYAKSRRPGICIVHCVLLCVRVLSRVCHRYTYAPVAYPTMNSFRIFSLGFEGSFIIPFDLHASTLIKTQQTFRAPHIATFDVPSPITAKDLINIEPSIFLGKDSAAVPSSNFQEIPNRANKS